jgi:hypothetical protein
MACEQARAYVMQKLADAGVNVDDEQIEQLAQACCQDMTSQACNEAIGKVTTTVVCAVYTEGACVPCCKMAGEIIGPIVAKGVAIVVGIGKALWDAISSLFGGGSCDFDPAYNDIHAKLAASFRDLVAHLAGAWADAREAAGLSRDEPTNREVNKIPGYDPYQVPGETIPDHAWVVKGLDGRLVIMTGEEAALRIRYLSGEPDLDIPLIAGVDYAAPPISDMAKAAAEAISAPVSSAGGRMIAPSTSLHTLFREKPADLDVRIPFLEGWESILTWTATWYANKTYPWFRWTVDGDDNAEMVLPQLPAIWSATDDKPMVFYQAWWKGWDCKNGKQWGSCMQDIMTKRQNAVLAAAQYLGPSMAQAFVRQQQATRVAQMAAAQQVAASEAKSASTTAWLVGIVGVAALGALGYAVYQDAQLRRLSNPTSAPSGYFATGWGSRVGPFASRNEAVEAFEREWEETPQQVVHGRVAGGELVGDVVWSEGWPGDKWESNPPKRRLPAHRRV